MMTHEEFEEWCRARALTEPAVALIKHVRSSPPARRVGNRGGNVIHAFPSRKMGHTVQAESRTVEFPAIYLHEHRPKTLEYWDQPPKITFRYQQAGRTIAFKHTADFFVLETMEAGWEEWKPEGKLVELNREDPDRFVRDADGHWRCPPGEAYAAQFGLFYRVCSSAMIDPVLVRNLVFLHDFLREDVPEVQTGVAAQVAALVIAQPGESLTQLRQRCGDDVTADHLFTLIVQERIYVDLSAAPLADPGRVHLFRDRATATALTLAAPSVDFSEFARAMAIVAEPGTRVEWDGLAYSIVNVGRTAVVLKSEHGRLAELELPFWKALLGKGSIRPLAIGDEGVAASTSTPAALARIIESGPRQLSDANGRSLIIRPRLLGQGCIMTEVPVDAGESLLVPVRTERSWRAIPSSIGAKAPISLHSGKC